MQGQALGYLRTTPTSRAVNLTQPGLRFSGGLYEPFNAASGSVNGAYANLFQVGQEFAYAKGSHAIKMGAEVRFNRHAEMYGMTPNGSYTFGGGPAYAQVEIASYSGRNDIHVGDLLPDTLTGFLTATPSAYRISAGGNAFPQADKIGLSANRREACNFYFQDNWKITPRVMLNWRSLIVLLAPDIRFFRRLECWVEERVPAVRGRCVGCACAWGARQSGASWTLEVRSNIGDVLQLSLEAVESLPPGVSAVLIDQALKATLDIRQGTSYAYVNTGVESARRFSIAVGTEGYVKQMVEQAGAIPEAYQLSQNFPNPFNPMTTIRYGLPVTSHITLTVYNLVGQKVALLADEVRPAGYPSAVFDGLTLASGVYLYRMTAEAVDGSKASFSEVHKLTFLK